tara:strand:- start:1959 stop:2252 length:294 start_codon:yes stop_codon:yes gene_type:complete
MKRIFIYIIVIFLLLLGVTFAIVNSSSVSFNYFFNTAQVPLSLLMVITFAVGAVFGMIAALGLYFSTKKQTMRLQREMKLAKKEIANLRAIPINDEH